MLRARLSAVAAVIVSLFFSALVSGAAVAEEGDFPVERFRPSTTRDGLLDVEWGGVGEHLQWDGALWVNYALNPLVIYDGDQRVGALIAHRVGGNLTGSIALFDWVELAADLPVVLFQTRDESLLPGAVNAEALSATGIGDLRLAPKIRLLRSREQLIDLAIIPAFTLPSEVPYGSSYVGEAQPTFVPEVAASRALDDGPLSGLRGALNVGYRVRPEERSLLNVTIGHELLYKAGVGYRFADTLHLPLELDATLSGSTYAFAPFRAAEESPLEVKAGVKYDVFAVPAAAGAGDSLVVQAFGGAGTGLVNGFGTPDLRLFAGLRLGPPRDIDADDDGIADSVDACVNAAEDKDGFDDVDGCPDKDNDKDGIDDDKDACDNEAEDVDAFEDTDGCPDLDNDKDGVADKDDACRDVAEDKDGFEDNDGCVDADNDKDGVPDRSDSGDDGCRDVAGPKENKGCPWPDTDKDGLTDNVDVCPTLAGDKAHKGCPDSDGDGFTDDKDKCPNEAETVNNVSDDDGCPDEGKVLVTLTKTKIVILDKVFFDTGKASIKDISNPLLQQVATVLKTHAEIAHVRVEGHTDSDGDDDKNLGLSQDRANAVRDALVALGVDASRLVAKGFGESQPVADNADKQGKEQNRRVEFVLVNDDDAGATDAPR